MADDPQEPPGTSPPGGREPGDRDELDQTREFDPFADERPPSADRPGAPSEPTTRAAHHPTEPPPAHQPTGPHEAARHEVAPPTDPRWSGRAGVPPPPATGPGPTQWYPADDDRSDRRWWTPILFGVVALVLLGVLGFGLWLIANARRQNPAPTPSVPTAGVPSSTVAPTSAAPTPRCRPRRPAARLRR
ncbi:hypothetical protein [Micromonospora zhanjiangensis]